MNNSREGASSFLALLFFFSGTGCSGSSSVNTEALELEYRRSPSAMFHYRIPQGWQDLSMRNSSESRHIWLSDAKFTKSIELREVFLNEATGREAPRDGLRSVAEVLASLAQDRDSLVLIGGVSTFTERDTKFWEFKLRTAKGDHESVALFSSGELFYEIRLVERGNEVSGNGNAVMLREFVSGLRW